MKYLRTFIAVPIQVGNDFLEARAELMELLSGERISWVEPERYHVTIRFLGDTSQVAINTIRSGMRERLELPPGARPGLGSAGSFGPMKKPGVIWIGFIDSTFFHLLKKEVDKVLNICGIPATGQTFRAHLTLGRIRRLKDRNGYYQIMDSMKDRFSGEVPADRLVFYKSELTSLGPLYTPLEELLLPDQPL